MCVHWLVPACVCVCARIALKCGSSELHDSKRIRRLFFYQSRGRACVCGGLCVCSGVRSGVCVRVLVWCVCVCVVSDRVHARTDCTPTLTQLVKHTNDNRHQECVCSYTHTHVAGTFVCKVWRGCACAGQTHSGKRENDHTQIQTHTRMCTRV
eukprot:GDKI01029707.1.p1 GENE.GDKI01029707.1~~GDKI01029707.1.p1  ORF type:complete len:153 (-),score=68.53 GDKI01029707.1:45-503(-)